MSTEKSGVSGSQGRSVAPLYQRLPHGPHRLDPAEVTLNQRMRMYGAMIEAVAANGYERTSVKQVVGLAGVSRRSFYEQFPNKQECFLATFDMIAGRGAWRVGAAYRAAEGDIEERLRAAFGELGEAVRTNWKGAALVIVEAPKVGAPGFLRVRRATATFEQMLSGCFEQAPDASALPGPVIRGIAGGLHAAIWMCLREGSEKQMPGLAEEMLRWTLLFQTPAAALLAERLAERARCTLANGRQPGNGNGNSNGHGPNGAGPPSGDERKRLLEQALRLALVVDYQELSAPQIADAAQVPIDGFFELFDDKQDCFLAALDMLGEELVALTDDPDLLSSDWPRAVRRVIGELGRYLAEHPIYAQTIASSSYVAGPEAIERNLQLAYMIATRLTNGAPEQARSRLVLEGVAGALAHTVRCQVASGQIQLLPVLSDYLSYIVLTPFIGADAAAALVAEDAP